MESCPVKQFLDEKKDFYIEQLTTGCLAQYAYYIESNGEAAVIDPMRDTENIIKILQTRNAKLKYVFETHFHADFVSGHLDLAEKTGAQIVYGPGAVANFKIIAAEDNQIFQVGNIKIKVIHTPGHTLESSCFILIDEKSAEKAIFTGDTVFLGDVGRPDLAVKSDLTERDLASKLYDSLQKIKNLNDDIIIFPGHGAGSACGKNISVGIGDSLKNQRKINFGFDNKISKQEFIEIATSGLPTPPKYFFFDAKMNKEGYESVENLLNKTLKSLNFEEFESVRKQPDVVVVDSRDPSLSTRGFLRGSYLIPLNITYAIWCATLFKPEHKILFITYPGTEKESIIRLFRVGYYNILGYLEGGIDTIKEKSPENIATINKIDYDQAKKLIDENKVDLFDVREQTEFENTGVIENSKLYPLSDLEKKIEEAKKFQKPLGIYCRTGGRATIASSIFNKYNYNNFYLMGAFTGLVEKGVKVVKYLKK